MTPADFEVFATLLKERSGLSLTPEKEYLLQSRLTPVARNHGLEGLEKLAAELRSKRPEPLIREVVEAMTTNESFFFRDGQPFEVFRKTVLPALIEARKSSRRLRIWSAACSTGQEPYSLAMILKEEAAKLSGWRIEILGTDLSSEVLQKARAGVYSQFEVQRGLPIQMLMGYFQQIGEMWQIDAAIRGMVEFKEFNLLGDLRPLGQFDVIFCRNVLIYFDQATKGTVLANMSARLPDDGALFLGAAETVLGLSQSFKPVPGQRGMYARAA